MAANSPAFTSIRDAKTPGQVVSLIGVVISTKTKEPRKTQGLDLVLEFAVQDDFTAGASTINCRLFHRNLGKFPPSIVPGDISTLR